VLARDPQLLFNQAPTSTRQAVETCWRHMKGFGFEKRYDHHMESCAGECIKETHLRGCFLEAPNLTTRN